MDAIALDVSDQMEMESRSAQSGLVAVDADTKVPSPEVLSQKRKALEQARAKMNAKKAKLVVGAWRSLFDV